MRSASESGSSLASVAETRPIEWPPKSGAIAEYTPAEENFLRSLIGGCEAGYLDEAQLVREVEIFHGLKTVLDARVIGDGEAGEDPVEPPPVGSFFQIPARAVDLLAKYDPQQRIA